MKAGRCLLHFLRRVTIIFFDPFTTLCPPTFVALNQLGQVVGLLRHPDELVLEQIFCRRPLYRPGQHLKFGAWKRTYIAGVTLQTVRHELAEHLRERAFKSGGSVLGDQEQDLHEQCKLSSSL